MEDTREDNLREDKVGDDFGDGNDGIMQVTASPTRRIGTADGGLGINLSPAPSDEADVESLTSDALSGEDNFHDLGNDPVCRQENPATRLEPEVSRLPYELTGGDAAKDQEDERSAGSRQVNDQGLDDALEKLTSLKNAHKFTETSNRDCGWVLEHADLISEKVLPRVEELNGSSCALVLCQFSFILLTSYIAVYFRRNAG